VIVKEAVANGRLTGRAAAAALIAAASERGVGPDAIAIAAALAQPWSDVVLSGASMPEMLDSNLAAQDLDVRFDLLPELAEPADEYWSTRSHLAWN
jgi:aryl-alcohol dehydrogenase-like predicted oxidoreductase